MTSKASLSTEVISQAESYDGIRAGIVRLKDVLKGYSYKAAPDDSGSQSQLASSSCRRYICFSSSFISSVKALISEQYKNYWALKFENNYDLHACCSKKQIGS